MTIKILFISHDETVRPSLVEADPDFQTLRSLIGGGYLEGIGVAIDSDWFAYCDEEGRLKDLPVNVRASRVVRLLGGPVERYRGHVIFVGNSPGPEGVEEADVPDEVLALVRTMYGEILPPVDSAARRP